MGTGCLFGNGEALRFNNLRPFLQNRSLLIAKAPGQLDYSWPIIQFLHRSAPTFRQAGGFGIEEPKLITKCWDEYQIKTVIDGSDRVTTQCAAFHDASINPASPPFLSVGE
jgi:hypothetical protein